MNYAENPITDLANCIAHAQYVGFLDIEYERMDYDAVRNARTAEEKRASMSATVKALRRPTTRDFGVYAMFPQTWGSTALGHGGMGGAAVTTAYTVVLECYHTQEFLVYFGGQMCYKVNRDSANFDIFIEDCKNHKLVSKRESSRYGN
jgi:hypothetical protein